MSCVYQALVVKITDHLTHNTAKAETARVPTIRTEYLNPTSQRSRRFTTKGRTFV